MREIIGYILVIIFGLLILIGISTLFYMYLTYTNVEHLLTLNILLVFAIAIIQIGLTLINYRKRLNLIPILDLKYKLTDSQITKIAWKRQINLMNIIAVFLGTVNLILYLTSPNYIEKYNLIAIIGVLFPILGFFETYNLINKKFRNQTIKYHRHNDSIEISIGEKRIDFNVDNLVNTKLIDKYILAQISKTKETIIIPTKNE